MVSPSESMEAVANAIAKSGKLPAETSVLLHEADTASDGDVGLPLLEIQPVEVDNIVLHNTDFSGFVTDDAGNHVGRIYLSEYEMGISINIWTAEQSGYDPDELGNKLREALYPYSSYGPDQPFLDDEDEPIDQITYFRLATGERTDDLIQTPTVRRWSQEVELWGFEEFRTDEDYIVDVTYPEDGDFNDEDEDGTIDDVVGNNE